LIEVLSAITLLMLFSASIFPLLTIIYQERVSIQEEENVLHKLEETLHHYVSASSMSNNDGIVIRKETVDGDLVRFCAEWVATNGRVYERCLLASK
jgi:type II secretory pathway pseudopilin PulG